MKKVMLLDIVKRVSNRDIVSYNNSGLLVRRSGDDIVVTEISGANVDKSGVSLRITTRARSAKIYKVVSFEGENDSVP